MDTGVFIWKSTSNLGLNQKMVTVGFEPTKHNAHDLKSGPVDQAWVRYQYIHDGIRTRNLQIRSLTRYPVAPHGPMTRDTFSPELFKSTNLLLRLVSNQRPTG